MVTLCSTRVNIFYYTILIYLCYTGYKHMIHKEYKMTLSIEDILERVRVYAKLYHPEYTHLSLKVGLSRAALKHIFTEKWQPSTQTLRQLEKLIPHDFDHTKSE